MPIIMKKVLAALFAVALGLNLSAQTECSNPQDANQDGVIGVDDLMDLLSHWGDTDFDFDGVYDSVDLCTDEGACNYLSNPTESCLYLDAIGACGGDCAEDTDGDGVCDEFYVPCQGQSTVTYQDYTYDLVAIGPQCWFAENLRSSNFLNGENIPLHSIENPVEGTNPIYKAAYDDDSLSVEENGFLYSWYATDDSRGVCPLGWHVPAVEEFQTLFEAVGGISIAAFQLKAQPPIWNGDDSFGYTALPSGYLALSDDQVVDDYYYLGSHAYFWTNTSTGPVSAYYVLLRPENMNAQLYPSNGNLAEDAMSVRCLKDTE